MLFWNASFDWFYGFSILTQLFHLKANILIDHCQNAVTFSPDSFIKLTDITEYLFSIRQCHK
jgi:uncharacterized membrane protein